MKIELKETKKQTLFLFGIFVPTFHFGYNLFLSVNCMNFFFLLLFLVFLLLK